MMDRIQCVGRALLLCLWGLAGMTAGCFPGAHSTASQPHDVSRLADASQPTDASQPIYLAQLSCWDTESCCIVKDPLTAVNRCMVTPARIVEVLNGVKALYGTTQAGAARLKEDAQAKEDAEFAEAAEAEGEAA